MMKTFFLILFYILAAGEASAEPITEKRDNALWVKSATTAETEKIFKAYNFNDFNRIKMKFPRIYFLRLPKDWRNTSDSEDKHRTFIRIILPLVLKINEEILTERREIINLQESFQKAGRLSDEKRQFLEEKAKKYDVFTRFKDTQRISMLLAELLDRVDEIPPSLLVATAGIYSDWGNSRLARQANSLYLTEIWYDTKGLKPLDDENAEYRYKIYSSLEESIKEQALKINSHVNYFYFRAARKEARRINRPLYGSQWAATMLADSNLKNIAGLIDYTFTYYGLQYTDYKAKLEDIE